MEDKKERAIDALVATENNISDVYEALLPLMSSDFEDTIDQLKPLESSKLHIGIAFTLASLYYVALRSQVIR